MAALRRRGLRDGAIVGHGRYERNTKSVESGLADLLQLERPPRAVILVGAYAPCAAFIRLAHQQKLDALFLNVSFVGTESLAEALGADGEGVIVTQVVPHYDADLPGVRDYRRAIRETEPAPPPSFTSLEGYLAARTLLLALRNVAGAPSREGIADALDALGDFDLGLGEPLRIAQGSHQACHRVWPTVIRKGRAVPFAWTDLAPAEKR
jgi:ABC-type branched-subunit amino acid transport system substrate-binding protein